MLKILIVEDEPLLATTLKYLIELNPRYQVTAIADDLESALEAAVERRPDLALVDLQLAHDTTGYSVAVKLNEMDIPCLFATGNIPPFPMPDLALGCLSKPYFEEDIVRTLKTAEDLLRGRERIRPSLPEALELYRAKPDEDRHASPPQGFAAMANLELLPIPPSLTSRLFRWWAG